MLGIFLDLETQQWTRHKRFLLDWNLLRNKEETDNNDKHHNYQKSDNNMYL